MVDDPAGYRWSSHRACALGEPQPILTPHPLYLALGKSPTERQSAYRALFRAHIDPVALDDIRLSLNQSQPLGDRRFHDTIARMLGERRQPRPRGRPRSPISQDGTAGDQVELPL